MTTAEVRGPMKMPDSAFAMWERGELDEYLHVPDGSRVEIIGGEVVVSPCPRFGHGHVVQSISRAVYAAELADESFRWQLATNVDLSLIEIQDGYVPDLFLLDRETHAALLAADSPRVYPAQLALAVEVTSPSNAADDRPPGLRPRRRRTKWNGYAASGVPFYLLIDRDPQAGCATLFWSPDRTAGTYDNHRQWKFGEPIELPAPFHRTLTTDSWTTWTEE
ncbi:Uma2 family endonuclease [Nocardia sp. NPDC058705]|uniref:Uma2 family endonuclease n=1 Tax=Nocardia sp. NPDC058705 TaxID=3346609 RepID=UPI00368B56EC